MSATVAWPPIELSSCTEPNRIGSSSVAVVGIGCCKSTSNKPVKDVLRNASNVYVTFVVVADTLLLSIPIVLFKTNIVVGFRKRC